MSILYPGHLSGVHTSRYQSHSANGPPPNGWLPPECEPDIGDGGVPWTSAVHTSAYMNPLAEGSGADKMPSVSDPLKEFDEYGTELGKEARVWKVYVKETDAWDAELVDGWNKSLDVILVFAALFSAISTAFLIQSTGLLQENSADVTAQTLQAISKTLYAIANNSSPPESIAPTGNETTGFTPSRSSVVVNTLWYLSLGLSIATSFLAMLAKDWCHSFMAHRSGHPYLQARRRQQKWIMIERWKMQELMAALPLLIHIALLLFAIGLCIYVWDMNRTVAIPIICVTGAAMVFYASSTLAATVINSFPYTTIVSRILDSRPLRISYVFLAYIVLAFSLLPLLLSIPIGLVVGRCWEKFNKKILKPGCSYLWITVRKSSQLVGRLCWNTIWAIIWHCGALGIVNRALGAVVGVRASPLLAQNRETPGQDTVASQAINWLIKHCEASPLSAQNRETPGQDTVTSQAISWLIKHCEAPDSVDIALQAIAGANGRLPHQPLEECGASLAILQLLASSSLYKGSRQKANEKRISLYVRALSFLGSQGNSTNTGDLEVMLWDLQAENEKTVSALIADGKFTPEDHNLAALRIGSIAPSQCLQLLKDSNQDSHAFLNLIIPLLEKHADQTQELHPAARLSLVNATILLWACMTSNEVPVAFPGLLMQILYNDVVFWGGDLDLVPGPSNPMTLHAQKAFQVFLARQSANKDEQRRFISFGTLEILSNASQYNINLHENGAYRRTLEMAQEGTSTMMAELPLPVDRLKAPRSEECVVLPIVESLNQVYTIVPASTPDQGVYMFVVECMLCVDSSPVGTLCWSLMTGFSFPKLCAKLLEYVDSRSLIQVFHRNLDDSYSKTQFFAAAQLWLLCTLYLDSPADVIEVDRAKLILILEQSPLLRDDKLTVDQAKDRMGLRIEELAAEIERPGTHTVYTLRVLECVLQSRGAPPTDPRWERINRELGDVPQALRGLGSFIPLPMRQPLTTIQPENILDGRHISISLEGGGNSSGEP